MKAGHSLDVRIAKALGWDIHPSGSVFQKGTRWFPIPDFSTEWDGMGVLVEEAAKEGIFLEYEHFRNGRYMGRAWKFCDESDGWISMPNNRAIKPPIADTAALAVSLVFLEAKGIGI
ncbi:hypothetical protein AYJ08_00340 [Brevibacillus sp. SKDU10]|uniref:hypothetical protein n=1 Tax=Brevibacillus sp. SKDU10 TaxID=1247872 RepID=UPI0007C8FED4|nr:hypothetical protein [Brevibacillus sp. SKDU10]OAJ75232.1 hypothetical protein AYJ08_00340 [Brevibacillus sp. SKDU10]